MTFLQSIFGAAVLTGSITFSSVILSASAHADTSSNERVQASISEEAKCKPSASGGAVWVEVPRLKDTRGNVRIELYRNDPENFLRRAGRELRIERDAKIDGFSLCLRSETRGSYAVVIMHDRNANGKFDAFTDGVGLSQNPKLGRSRPPIEPSLVTLNNTTIRLSIQMNYMRGFSMRPIG